MQKAKTMKAETGKAGKTVFVVGQAFAFPSRASQHKQPVLEA
ncbi:hypothetical protein SHPE106448_18000 [Shewanella pealeana]